MYSYIYIYIYIYIASIRQDGAHMEMGQWVMGHGSNGSPFLDGSRQSWVTASDRLTNDNEITAQWPWAEERF